MTGTRHLRGLAKFGLDADSSEAELRLLAAEIAEELQKNDADMSADIVPALRDTPDAADDAHAQAADDAFALLQRGVDGLLDAAAAVDGDGEDMLQAALDLALERRLDLAPAATDPAPAASGEPHHEPVKEALLSCDAAVAYRHRASQPLAPRAQPLNFAGAVVPLTVVTQVWTDPDFDGGTDVVVRKASGDGEKECSISGCLCCEPMPGPASCDGDKESEPGPPDKIGKPPAGPPPHHVWEAARAAVAAAEAAAEAAAAAAAEATESTASAATVPLWTCLQRRGVTVIGKVNEARPVEVKDAVKKDQVEAVEIGNDAGPSDEAVPSTAVYPWDDDAGPSAAAVAVLNRRKRPRR